MKKIGLLLAALLVAVIFVNAQPPGGQGGNFDPEQMIKRQVDQIVEACGLSKEQTQKVEAIVRKGNEKRMEMFQDMGGGGDREAMREKMNKMRDEQTKEIKAVLTEEQAKKYDKFLEEQEQRRRERGFGGGM
ncbi:MAG: hypothetical protein JXR31_01165 [Prolixibacteraceae bacterium]|nr:hypothetical protein [Prolixibacteraceae bacterium]MBN2772826.1 hypothetical protein [Prolixibacteraceae bacterium]